MGDRVTIGLRSRWLLLGLTVCLFLQATGASCTAEDAVVSPTVIDRSVKKDDSPATPNNSKDKESEKKSEKDKEESKSKDDGAKPGVSKDIVNTELEIIPPPPAPTPAEIVRRQERAAEYQTLGEKTFNYPVTGSLLNRYRIRHGVGETDQDISEFITVDIGEKARDMATAHIDAGVFADLNRHHKGRRSDVFSDLWDTYNQPVNARVYSAYVDFNKICGVDFLRVGRQFDYDAPEILEYEGARLDTKAICALHDLAFSFYAGAPVHQFEKSLTGDWLAGLAAEIKPWDYAKFRFDYIHINDNFSDWVIPSKDPLLKSLSANGGTRTNEITSLSFWQAFKNPNLNVNGHFSLIDGEARDLQIRSVYNNTCERMQISGTYSIWFKPETQLVTEFDPYYETLRRQEPYQRGSVTFSKGLLECLWLDAGAASRRLVGDATPQLFNREFDRFFLTLQTRDFLKKGLKVSATASHWEGKDHAPSTTQYGGDVSYEWCKHLETTIGTDYELYKYDFFQNTEHDQDRTVFIRQRWKPTRWAKLDGRYEYEQSRSQRFHTFTMSFRFDF